MWNLDLMQPRRPVLSKPDMVRRYEAGEFGNGAPTWPDIYSWLRSGPLSGKGPTILANIRNRVAMAYCEYNIPSVDVYKKYLVAIDNGVKASDMYVSLMCPNKEILQGEVIRREYGEGINLWYTTVRKPMRDALREQSYYTVGSASKLILEHYLNPRSYEWLMALLDWYPGHTVEFTALDCEWGTVSGHNALFWEVRYSY
jgi:hypothetical protein